MPRKRTPSSHTPDAAEATAEALRQQARALADADRRKDDFIAMLAHELRTPLAPIRTALETLRRRRAAEGALLEHELLVIERQLDHLARLVDDLMDVARITRGRVELRRQRLELATIVAMAVETVEPELRRRRQRLEVALPEPPVPIDGDPVRLAQVLSNLLGNASKYSETGSWIGLSALREGDTVTVRVRDEGIGIPRERLAKVFDDFDPFDQLGPLGGRTDGFVERARDGLGLGLTLVKGLTEMHGGSVEAESEGPGEGSVFTVRLPAAEGDEAEAAAEASGSSRERTTTLRAASGGRVLVVDDSIDTAESFAELLRIEGHEALAVHDGAAALEAASALRPDVVFLDLGLPGMNGFDVAERLASAPGRRPLLVAVTGYGQEESRRRARAVGFDKVLLKPIDLREVLEILARALERPGT